MRQRRGPSSSLSQRALFAGILPAGSRAERKKPLGGPAYGSIPHLHGSRLGRGEHTVPEGEARICLQRTRDRHDVVAVQEKLDGACTAVAVVGGKVVALQRKGWLASDSPYEVLQLFSTWVSEREERFRFVLKEGERLVGEWLALAHGTRYNLPHEPWVAFDLMLGHQRVPYLDFIQRVAGLFVTPRVLHRGPAPFSLEAMAESIRVSGHGALDPVEGAVWRVERMGAFNFLAKWVRPGKVDGCYLPEVTGGPSVWNWRPDE